MALVPWVGPTEIPEPQRALRVPQPVHPFLLSILGKAGLGSQEGQSATVQSE